MFGDLTVQPGVAIGAGALVLVRASVAASPTVQTRLSRPTVVQVFVAELTTPIRLAKTLPWFDTGAMHTAWV